MMLRLFSLLLACLVISSARGNEKNWKSKSENPEFVHRAIKSITDIIVHDIYSPPVASRTYAYISIAGYEAAIYGHSAYLSLSGQLHHLAPIPKAAGGKELSNCLAAVEAIMQVGRAMVISEARVNAFHRDILEEFKNTGMPAEIYDRSLLFGKQVADHILAWAAKDQYKETRSLPKYALTEETGYWQPTPPAYMKAIEPNWNKIRPFFIDSAAQFKPLPAVAFSVDKAGIFYRQAMDVYEAGKKLTAEQTAIANFWDCNPFKMNLNGHVMYATKKISPGGHWINIAALSCKQTHADLQRTLEAYALLSVTMSDCFISCWDEKYRSRVIRPETYINNYIDEQWMPLLQTPPFPEYTSGHSVVSAAAAVVLSKFFGENFSYIDSTELEFGLPERKFTSFRQAAEEAAISRFYGGIHYMASIKNGFAEGNDIGVFIMEGLETRSNHPTNKK